MTANVVRVSRSVLSNPFDTLRAWWSARQARKRATDDLYAAADMVLGSRLDAMDRTAR